MVDLNLRVAALKPCAHSKRFSEMRGAMVPIPTSTDPKCESLTPFLEATNSIEQIEAAKKIFHNPDTLDFLADVLFASPLKHSLRGTLTNLFSNNGTGKKGKAPIHTHTQETLIKALSKALLQISVDISEPHVSIDFVNDMFVSVGGCLNNFPNGRDALAQVIFAFIPLVPKTLNRFWKCISDTDTENLSPTRRNEFYLFLQNLWRFHVAYLVEFKLLLQPESCQDLRLIDETAELVARHVDTPWDVRSIAGLAIGQNARFFNEFDEYLNKCNEMTEFENLPIKSASLLVLQKTDYAVYAEIALEILTGILDIVKQAGNITNLLVYMSKHLFTYSKSLTDIHLTGRPLIMYNIILTHLLRFSIDNLPSTVESIRHMSSRLMLHSLLLAKAGGQQNIINNIYTTFNSRQLPLNAACLMIQNLAEVEGTETVLNRCPGVYKSIFPTFLGVDDNVYTLYKNLMTAAHKELPHERWVEQWCNPLMRQAQDPDRIKTIERLIQLAVQLDPIVLGIIINEPLLPFSSKLAALLMARRCGQHKLVKSIMPDYAEQLSKAIVATDENTRLQALSFVAETPKLSESYTQFEIDTIIKYLENNANSPSGNLRQIGGGFLQKAIKRLELNVAQQLKLTNPLPEDHMLMQFINKLIEMLMLNLFPTANYGRRWLSMTIMMDIIGMMERLNLEWISKLPSLTEKYLFNCLRDSYEHNKVLAANLLQKMVVSEMYLSHVEILKMLTSLRPPDSMTGAYQLQVYCQAENVALLVPQPEQLTNYKPRYFAVLNWLLNNLKSGLEVAKKDLTLTAKTNPLYGLLFAIRHLLEQLDAQKVGEELIWRGLIEQLVSVCMIVSELMLPVVGSDCPEGHIPSIAAPITVDAKVEAEIALVEAANKAALENKTNEAVNELVLKTEPNESVLKNDSNEAVNESISKTDSKEPANELVSKTDSNEAVNESALETEPVTEYGFESWLKPAKRTDKKNVLSIVPQLVLLCAWRSVKEVCLILGGLVEQAPLQQENLENYVLSKQQVSDIGEHFLNQLAEIKHRGAFEQAYVGFSMLCRRFWVSNASELNAMPIVWLHDSMDMISGKTGSKAICPTRRSAGVPYIMQALICTELQLGTNNTFSKSMSLLLDVCERRQSGRTAAGARSHALNILRALFRCSELSDLVGEYIERGVQCGLESIDAEEWAERNSATLLLSALMIRIFGVERARNDVGELHIRNRMTGRIFFRRYPKLFDYFHDGLRREANAKKYGDSTTGQTLKLEAMLQFLSRLYPSSLEGTEDTLNLSNFVDNLQIICCVHDDMTRQRASKVLANFMSPTLAENNFGRILNRLKVQLFYNRHFNSKQFTKDYNGLHGNLLQLLELYRIVRWSDLKLISRALRLLSRVAVMTYAYNMGLFNAVLNVLIAILKDAKDAQDIDRKELAKLETLAKLEQQLVHKKCKKYAISPKFHYVFALHLNRLTANPEEMSEHMLSMLIRPTSMPEELQQFTFELLLCLLLQQSNPRVENIDIKNFHFDPDVVIYCKSLDYSLRQRLAFILQGSEEATRYVWRMANKIAKHPRSNPDLGSKVHTLLALMSRLELTIPQLLQRRNCNLEPGLVMCMTRQLETIEFRKKKQQKLWQPLLQYALDISVPTEKPFVRFQAAQLVNRLGVHVQGIVNTGDVEIISNYMLLVLKLLVDDSEIVRNFMAENISSTSSADNKKSNFVLIPMAAENLFLQHVFEKMQQFANNDWFLINLFNIIVDAFVSFNILYDEQELQKKQPGEEVDVEVVFEKEEPNVYCERLRVVGNIIKEFGNAFPNNKELQKALGIMEVVSQYSCINGKLT